MNTIGPMIADSANLCIGYAQRLLQGIQANQFGSYARVGDSIIESNHPAFIFGHLSLYPVRVVGELGGDTTSVQPSDSYQELFSPKARCQDDPEQSIYPAMEEITDKFFAGHAQAIEMLSSADDAAFQVENPNEKMRAKFATLGAMHAFYFGGHLMIHLGQCSAWRRAMGLGSA